MGQGAVTGIAIVVLALLLCGAGWLLWRWYHQPQRLLARRLALLAQNRLARVFIPDGLGGEIYLDHLLLTPRGLLLLDVQDHYGTVFAGEQLKTWTVQQPPHRVTFENPLFQLRERATAVNLLAPDIPLHSAVVFPDDTVFAKGRPDAVTTIAQLSNPEPQSPAMDEVLAEWSAQWQQICAAAKPT